MKYTIYQINMDRDYNNFAFEHFGNLKLLKGTNAIDSSIYDKVYEGEIENASLEDLYYRFNREIPPDYAGRSMSVSDVIEFDNNGYKTFHYCDSLGFKDIEFDPALTGSVQKEKIKVILCEPGKMARVAEIGTELRDLQRAVGGTIETYYPFEEEVCIVCNDEGKYNGMRPCRAIYGDDKKLMDLVFGPFFICDCSTDSFASLSQKQLERFEKQFKNPEHFFRENGEIKAIPYVPNKDKEAR